MPQFRVHEAPGLLGVTDDPVRRWIEVGNLPATKDDMGRKVIDGVAPAAFVLQHGRPAVAVVKATTVVIETPGGNS